MGADQGNNGIDRRNSIDRDEITITVTVAEPELPEGATDADRAEAVSGRITGFREDTRDRRIAIARDAEHRFERKVAWAVTVGDRTALFTHVAVPVMTRLRQPERLVLDTLVAANAAPAILPDGAFGAMAELS